MYVSQHSLMTLQSIKRTIVTSHFIANYCNFSRHHFQKQKLTFHCFSFRFEISFPFIFPIEFQKIIDHSYSSYHLLSLRIKTDQVQQKKRYFFDNLLRMGIGVNLHYIPIYRQPYYSKFGFNYKNFPNAEKYYDQTITLPLYPNLSNKDLNFICRSFRSLF